MDEGRTLMNPSKSENSSITREQGHEFANIFSIIIANAEMVGEKLGAAGQIQRQLERIITACHRGEELVRRIRNHEEAQKIHEEVLPGAAFPTTLLSGRVLVVDDEADVVDVISRYLLKEGLQVQGMTESRLALERLHANPFCCDLMITDLEMPLLNGTELCRKVYELRPDLPVIMITGYDRRGLESPVSDLGIRELLLKPLDRHALLTAIRRLLTS